MTFARPEKQAWFNLAVLAAAAGLFLVLWAAVGLRPATGAAGVLGLWALGPIFYRPGAAGAAVDELEQLIQRRALVAGLVAAWLGMVGLGLGLWAGFGMRGRITLHVMPAMAAGSVGLFVVVQAVGTLVQYSIVYRHGSD